VVAVMKLLVRQAAGFEGLDEFLALVRQEVHYCIIRKRTICDSA
jgi:hypothetical protein